MSTTPRLGLAAGLLATVLATAALAQVPSPQPQSPAAPRSAPAAAPSTAAPAAPATAPAATPARAAKPLDINTATAAELDALPGIGEKRSEAIIKGRPYTRKDELVSKGVLTQATYDKIKDGIVAHRN